MQSRFFLGLERRTSADSVNSSPNSGNNSPSTSSSNITQTIARSASGSGHVVVEKSGWLTKKGKKRFFLLLDSGLYWFNKEQGTESDVLKKANGCINFDEQIRVTQVDSGKRMGIRINGSFEKGEYTVYAKDEQEMKGWIASLQKVVAKAAESKGEDTKQGYLVKEGKKFFFKLTKDYLSWFTSEQESSFRDSLHLLGYSVELKIGSPTDFVISNGSKLHEITASTVEIASDWVKCISKAISLVDQTPLAVYNQQKEWDMRVEVKIEGKTIVNICKSTETAQEIKDALFKRIMECVPHFDQCFSSDGFLLKINTINYYLMEESIPLFKLSFFKMCRKAFVIPKLEMILKTQLIQNGLLIQDLWKLNEQVINVKLEYNQQRHIDLVVGESFNSTLASKQQRNNEVHSFRRKMARFRLEASDQIKNILPEELESKPLPKTIPNSVTAVCNLPGDKQKTVAFEVESTVSEVKNMIFDKYKKIDIIHTAKKSVDDYLLKVTGFRSYFVSSMRKVIDYDYIRSCINKGEQVHLSLVEIDRLTSPIDEEQPLIDKILATEEDDDLSEDKISQDYVSNKDLTTLFSIKVNNVKNITLKSVGDQTNVSCFVLVELYHGGKLIDEPLTTRPFVYRHSIIPSNKEQNQANHNQWLAFKLPFSTIPPAARICFTVYVSSATETEANVNNSQPIGWVNYQFVDHCGCFSKGSKELRLWESSSKANPIGTCVDNISSNHPTLLTIEFEKNNKTVLFESVPITEAPVVRGDELGDSTEKNRDASILKKDSLAPLTDEEKKMLWDNRHAYSHVAKLLPKFLLSVDWTVREQVAEAYRMLTLWETPTAITALELLDSNFPDAKVRQYAISCLDKLNCGDLADYLLQLTQVLKYEAYHDSGLARFLLRRSLENKDQIGHYFFWHLRAEIHVPEIAERYGLLLEAYLRGCGTLYRNELVKQVEIMDQLTNVALKVKEISRKEERLDTLKFYLRQIEFPERFQIPLFTNVELKRLVVDKCKVMTSKKLPLWLVFENADRNGAPLTVIFKCGDDLRQDVLTLQMIRIMDKLWTREGFNLRLSPYGVIATGNETGMLEVVLDSETTASINREAGGSRSVLVKDTLTKWLKQNNPSEEEYKKAVENFSFSCAGYCVATYVIGIGDRHNDNIMMKRKGNLFHIDFGHFLGHFKTKFGFEREKAPFVFTPQYAHILGGKGAPLYHLFEELCCAAYNIIRKNHDLFINLFLLMLSTGLEELTSVENIMFLRDQLALDKSDEEASLLFKKLIEESLQTKTQQFMDIVHILKN